MLRQSAPAAAGLRRGDSSRLAFLHHLARGVSEPQGLLAACWPGGPPDSCLGGWWFCFIYSALASGSPCAEEKKETNCGECGGGTKNRREPSSGRERPGRSSEAIPWGAEHRASTAPAPRPADPARIFHVSFPFFFFPPLRFYFFSLYFSSPFPLSLPFPAQSPCALLSLLSGAISS